LETVANFIISNSKITTPSLPTNQGYIDPYTGSNRYVPPSNNTSSSGTNSQNNFTEQQMQSSQGYNTFFPQTNYLKFDQANTSSILSEYQFINNLFLVYFS
jgi:phospholipase A-2-activating protein